MGPVTIKFHEPYDFSQFENDYKSKPPDSNGNAKASNSWEQVQGVYIWAWPWGGVTGKEYAAYYVGESKGIGNRLHREFIEMRNGDKMLVDTPSSRPGDFVKYYLDGVTNRSDWDNLRKKNLEKIKIFCAECTEPKIIEGAIQRHLHQHRETRHFFETHVQNYAQDKTFCITGLDKVIGFYNGISIGQINKPY